MQFVLRFSRLFLYIHFQCIYVLFFIQQIQNKNERKFSKKTVVIAMFYLNLNFKFQYRTFPLHFHCHIACVSMIAINEFHMHDLSN